MFKIARKIIEWCLEKEPDFIIGDIADPYLVRRYVIPRNKFFNIYFHEILKSDYGRSLHNHPWFSLGIILCGQYIEHRKNGKSKLLKKGSCTIRAPWTFHRIENSTDPVYTLFITGPRTRKWGFLTGLLNDIFVPFEEYQEIMAKAALASGESNPAEFTDLAKQRKDNAKQRSRKRRQAAIEQVTPDNHKPSFG